MSDLISRAAAIEAIRASAKKYTGFMEMEMYTDDDAVKAIIHLPSAQPERKKGKWIEVKNKWDALEIVCSECGAQVPRDEWGNAMQSAYCPNCGARMVGGEE